MKRSTITSNDDTSKERLEVSPPRRSLFKTILAYTGLSFFVLCLVRPLLSQSGMPWGTDVYCHLARVWYLTKSFIETNSLPQWFPYWYTGNTLMQYYPPLSTYIMLPIQYFTNDISITYRIFIIGCLLVAAFATYKLSRRWVSHSWAVLGGILYVCAPFTLRTIFSEGHLPRIMAIALTPIVFYLLFDVIEKVKRWPVIWLTVASAALVLIHHQYAAVVMICLGFICLGTLIVEKEKRFTSLLALASMVIGIGLATWWLLPGLTHFDYPTVPDLSIFPERLHLYSIGWSAFWPGVRSISIEEIYIGSSLVVLAVLAAVLRRSLKNWLLLGTAIIGIALAFGTNNPVYNFLPMGSFLPERFLNVVILLLILLIIELGPAIQDIYRKIPMAGPVRLGCIVLIAIACWIDFAPYFSFPRMAQYYDVESAITSLPVTNDDSRLDTRGTPGGSEWSYLPLSMAEMKLAYGWSIETTPHLATIVQHNVAIREGFPAYILHNYALWNVRSFIGGPDEGIMLTTLAEAGFEEVTSLNGLTILHSPIPSTPVMELGANGIVIGRGAYNAVMAFPYLTLGKEWYLEDYDFEYLSHFNMVYLYDFRYHDKLQFEMIIKNLVRQGTMVILDLTNVPADTPFNVNTIYNQIDPWPVIDVTIPESEVETPASFEQAFGSEADRWRGVTYDGLDVVLATVTDADSEARPILGYKEIPEGRVYYLGLNIVGHIVDTSDTTATEFLDSFFSTGNIYNSINQPAFTTDTRNFSSDRLDFSYESDQEAMVLVSETWSPHWRAELDSAPAQIYNHEDLIALSLPAGSHSVSIRYVMTGVQWAGFIISLVFLGILIAGAIWFRYLPNLYRSVADKHVSNLWRH